MSHLDPIDTPHAYEFCVPDTLCGSPDTLINEASSHPYQEIQMSSFDEFIRYIHASTAAPHEYPPAMIFLPNRDRPIFYDPAETVASCCSLLRSPSEDEP